MIRKTSYLLLLSLLPIMLFAQENNKVKTYRFSILFGGNISNLKNDTLDTKGVFLPFLGVGITNDISDKFSIKGFIQYSFRASNVSVPFIKFRNDYLDIQAMLGYKIFTELMLEAGVQYSLSLNTSMQRAIFENTAGHIYNRSYKSQFEPLVGLDLKFTQRFNFAVLYSIPLKNREYNNLQFVISFHLIKKKNKK